MTTTMSFGYQRKGSHRGLLGFLPAAIAILCAAIWLIGNHAYAQSTGQGTISGTVTDSSGAVVVGARVTITNTTTSVSQNSVTNSTGYFEVDFLNPGTYSILVADQGFKTLRREGLILQTSAHISVPMRLSPGVALQTVTVTANSSLLNTESGESGQVLTTRQTEEIPVSGSNPMWLALIAPGVQGTLGQAASTGDGGGLLWNGQSTDFGNYGQIGVNEFSLDGAPNEDGRAAGINVSPDAVGEMQFDVTGYDASVGHTMGVAVTETTKAGTNQLHGTIRETYTPQRWEALNHFSGLNYRYQQSLADCVNGAATSPACYVIENTYGNPGTHANNGDAALGGPVYIPKVFNGHNKLFFFVSVLDDVLSDAGSQTATIPTLQERTGNFDDLPAQTTNIPAAFTSYCGTGTPYYGQYQIYNPYSVALDSNGIPRRTPICGNIIPPGLLANNAMVKLYNSLMPTPTENNPTGSNYNFTQISPQTFRGYTTREDYKLGANDSFFVRYTRQDYTKSENDDTVGDVGEQEGPRWIDVASVGWDHIFNANTNLDVTFGGTNFKTQCCYYPGFEKYNPGDLGLPSYTSTYAQTNASIEALPILEIANYENSNPGEAAASLGAVNNVANTIRSFALRGVLTRVIGRHTISAGAEWRLQNQSQATGGNLSGTYNFDDTYTQENNGSDPTYTQQNTGLSMAAFLMGVNTSQSVSQTSSFSMQSPYYAVYAGDGWRVTPKLTVIPGLRFEFEDGVVEKHNYMIVGWNPTADLSSISGPANAAYQAALAGATPAQAAVLPASLTIQGGPEYAGVNGNPRSAWVNSYRVLPRIAAAYQVTPRLVVRGGYGLFFDTMNAMNEGIDQDGFSASTSVNSSTNYGQTFTAPLSNPFPASASGANFNQPIGSAAGAYYYLGAGPAITEHSLVPAREQRGMFGAQLQFGAATLLEVSFNIARVTHLSVGKNDSFTPESFYAGGEQPNTAPNSLLNSQIPNPFALANFSGLASSDPVAYNLMSHSSYYTASLISISNLVRAYPQMGGLTLNEPLGASNFEELLINLTHRYSHGLTFMATLQVNNQHDQDYFANGYDPSPSWEPSNNSRPTRFTLEGVWKLPFGRGNEWANSGWMSMVFGGYQISGTYEAQPGPLVGFGNLFYVGTPSAAAIKIKQPIYVNDEAAGGSNYVQWLNPGNATATAVVNADGSTTCTYSGTGFVTNSSCQPSGYNIRVFPTHLNGVRQMGMNDANATVSRSFHLWERMNLETYFMAYNVFNHQVLGGVDTNPTDPNFGRVFGDGWPADSGRWLSIQGRLRF
jgi:Carboxypeptidase regulatory-like domain